MFIFRPMGIGLAATVGILLLVLWAAKSSARKAVAQREDETASGDDDEIVERWYRGCDK